MSSRISCRVPSLLALCLCLAALLHFPARLFAQAEDEKIVVLDHADSLVGREINGEQARELIGNVQFHQGKTVVTCERAVQFLKANRIDLEGTVEVRDDSMRMVGMRGTYDGNQKTAEAFDRVLLEEPGTILHSGYGKYFVSEKRAYFTKDVYVEDTASVLTSNELTYFREEQRSVAVGNVKIVSARNGLTIFGNRFENFRKQKRSVVTGFPMVRQVDTSGGGSHDTLVVTSLRMESYQDTLERLVAIDSVLITRGGLSAQSGISTMYTKLDSITLFRSPFVWYTSEKNDENQVSGDSIFIKLKERKLQTVYVRGRAIAISRADSLFTNRFNQMTGQEITLHFSGNKVQQIDVNMTATSLYYVFDEGKPNGANKISGDHVTILFAEGKMEKIKVVAGVEGQFFPEKMIRRRESSYNLEGFNWRERPKRRV